MMLPMSALELSSAPGVALFRVLMVNIKRDRNTGKNLGYGFVKMGSHREACLAKLRMNRCAEAVLKSAW